MSPVVSRADRSGQTNSRSKPGAPDSYAFWMPVCPNCGEDNPDKAKFCLECATPLAAKSSEVAEERKVVSILFVDLVGFAARSHDADPEDVRAALGPYHALLKREIERFGGTVEKFIGDAVMAVFGAPKAHEDDAERAVRATLRITEAIHDLNEATPNLELSIRAAVNTGEAVVALGARPQAGETMVTGDVVNTASRMQAVAPVGGIAVGEVTSYKEGAVIFTEGDPGETLLVLVDGLVKVYVMSEDGDEMVLTTLRPPEVFGELALLDGGRRSASAEGAREDNRPQPCTRIFAGAAARAADAGG